MARAIDRALGMFLALTVLAASACSSSTRSESLTSSATTQSGSAAGQARVAETDITPSADEPVSTAPVSTAHGSEQPADTSSADTTSARQAPVTPRVVKPRRKPGEPESITFDDLKIEMPVDSAFDPQLLTDRAKELDQQRVRISGFIAPTIFQAKGITSFPMLRNLECKFGPGGQAFCVIVVELKEGVTTDFTTKPVTVEGLLKIQPFNGADGITYALYHLDGEKVF